MGGVSKVVAFQQPLESQRLLVAARLRPRNDNADARAVRGAAGKEPLDEQALGKHAYKQMMAQESQVFCRVRTSILISMVTCT